MEKIIKGIVVVLLLIIFFEFIRFTLVPALDKLVFSFTRQSTGKLITPQNKNDCLKNNGEWIRPGPWPKEICMLKNKDGGKFCLAGFQCESGHCLHYGGPTKGPIFTTGYCAKYRILFGCLQEVHFGLTSNSICLD